MHQALLLASRKKLSEGEIEVSDNASMEKKRAESPISSVGSVVAQVRKNRNEESSGEEEVEKAVGMPPTIGHGAEHDRGTRA